MKKQYDEPIASVEMVKVVSILDLSNINNEDKDKTEWGDITWF